MSTGNKSFSSSDGSNSTGTAAGQNTTRDQETMSAEQVGKMFGLDEITVQCLAARPYNPEDPVLIIEPRTAFYQAYGNDWVAKLNDIVQALVAKGGQRVGGMKTVFAYESWQTLLDTRYAMQENPDLEDLFYLPASREEMKNRDMLLGRLMIKSCVLNSVKELHEVEQGQAIYQIQKGYEFFLFR